MSAVGDRAGIQGGADATSCMAMSPAPQRCRCSAALVDPKLHCDDDARYASSVSRADSCCRKARHHTGSRACPHLWPPQTGPGKDDRIMKARC
jgi:hypothetical protein